MAEALGVVASLIVIGQAVAAVPLIVDALVSLAHTSDELTDLLNEVRTYPLSPSFVASRVDRLTPTEA